MCFMFVFFSVGPVFFRCGAAISARRALRAARFDLLLALLLLAQILAQMFRAAFGRALLAMKRTACVISVGVFDGAGLVDQANTGLFGRVGVAGEQDLGPASLLAFGRAFQDEIGVLAVGGNRYGHRL